MTAGFLTLSAPGMELISFAKAAGFFFATFVLEDVALVGAGLLLAAGGISLMAAFASCFLGIWIGDAGLYALARYAGRGWFERSSLHRFAAKVTEYERWFGTRGTSILIFSRVVPGARLPTHLAAGFLRVPLPRFLLITGIAASLWTGVILFLVQYFGQRLSGWLGAYKHFGLWLVVTCVVLLFVFQKLHPLLRKINVTGIRVWLNRWTQWEFWPAWLFYPPVGIYCLWLALKYRGLSVATAANPGMFSGGIVGESKIETLKDLMQSNPEFTAEAELISGETLTERLLSFDEIRTRRGFEFPMILKPDVGQRGAGIKLIYTTEQADAYFRQTCAPLIVQRYASGPREAGIFYYRFPHEQQGHIFAITEKVFPKLVGDGQRTVVELILHDHRAKHMADTYLRRFADRRNEVLPMGEDLKLVEAGNHAQGCIFRDGMDLCTPELVARIDTISKNLTGFFIGRYDMRYETDEDLRTAQRFQIIELNGAASEATSIYDARNSIFNAYRTLFKQWDLVFAIGEANRRRGCLPTKLPIVWNKWREYSRMVATYPSSD